MTAVTQRNNLAYDTRRLARKEHTDEKQPQIRELKRKKSTAGQNKTSVGRIVAAMVVVVLMLSALLYTRVVQVEVAKEFNKTASALAAVKGENSTLMKQLEDKLSIANVEEIARDTLGMQKTESHQVHYITFETTDSAEVLKEPGFFEQIGRFFAGLFS